MDASALVKLYVAETGSGEVGELIQRAGTVSTGLLSRAEVPSALAKAARMGWMKQDQAAAALQAFRAQWADFICIQATEALMSLADQLAWEQGLRGYDAVHLASALTWQEALGEPVTLATFDRQLWDAASQVGMLAWPDMRA